MRTVIALLAKIRGILAAPGRAFYVHALIIGAVCLVANFSFRSFLASGRKTAVSWSKGDSLRVTVPDSLAFPSVQKASPAIRIRLREQIAALASRSERHFVIMEYYYSRYYMSIAMVLVFGVISSATLVLLVNVGWKDGNPFIKTTFIACSMVTAFFGSFPTVFQHSQNIADNKRLYIKYVALHNESLSYLTTGESMDKTILSPQVFIHYLDNQLSQLNTFAIGFDDSRIPDFKKSFKTE